MGSAAGAAERPAPPAAPAALSSSRSNPPISSLAAATPVELGPTEPGPEEPGPCTRTLLAMAASSLTPSCSRTRLTSTDSRSGNLGMAAITWAVSPPLRTSWAYSMARCWISASPTSLYLWNTSAAPWKSTESVEASPWATSFMYADMSCALVASSIAGNRSCSFANTSERLTPLACNKCPNSPRMYPAVLTMVSCELPSSNFR
mmetsp:Transcript_7257/g.20573  ORF Transcript_7257/g.20573 Transcript_7257/m.20573 type:complete len:204 (-) Transcript_7257:156-767(-)